MTDLSRLDARPFGRWRRVFGVHVARLRGVSLRLSRGRTPAGAGAARRGVSPTLHLVDPEDPNHSGAA